MKKTIFIAESDGDQKIKLEEYFDSHREFEVIGSSDNGSETVEEVMKTRPDILLCELIMPIKDGYTILNELKNRGSKTEVYIVSSLSKETFVNKAIELGAKYYMCKPISPESMAERILGISNMTSERATRVLESRVDVRTKTLEEKITNVFITVGIPAHIKGYQFLREAVKMAVERPEIINAITKKLYPAIAEHYSTTPSKVERAIRHAIEVAWNKGRIENINNIFGLKVYTAQEKPTNGEFIALVADKMLIEGV
ncbi:MAG: sporulation transcription factor Spo0A [Clostridia bacterium]|nr:sporulation transcription factor Spo0A [Clostridia bacterium]